MPHFNHLLKITLVLLTTIASLPNVSADDKAAAQAELRSMRIDALNQLYKENPKAKKQIRSSAGYGVFGVMGAQILIFGGSGGRGIVRDNLTGRDTFMKMGSVSAGLGVGFKDIRTILIFRNRNILKQFLNDGWVFAGEASAVAKSGTEGGSAGELETPEGISIFQITKTGLMANGSVQETKYWKDEDLN